MSRGWRWWKERTSLGNQHFTRRWSWSEDGGSGWRQQEPRGAGEEWGSRPASGRRRGLLQCRACSSAPCAVAQGCQPRRVLDGGGAGLSGGWLGWLQDESPWRRRGLDLVFRVGFGGGARGGSRSSAGIGFGGGGIWIWGRQPRTPCARFGEIELVGRGGENGDWMEEESTLGCHNRLISGPLVNYARGSLWLSARGRGWIFYTDRWLVVYVDLPTDS